ncbi:MAG: type II toxin-antitoxin system RelE/ParE family toxin [Phycisphaerales bacterium]
MTLPVVITPEARLDMATAIAYYNEAARIGELFRLEVDRTIGLIQLWPEGCEVLEQPYRRAVMHHFGYLVVYRILPGCIRVIAVIAAARDPQALAARLTSNPN